MGRQSKGIRRGRNSSWAVSLRHQVPVSDRLDRSLFHPHRVAPIGGENGTPKCQLGFSGELGYERGREAPPRAIGTGWEKEWAWTVDLLIDDHD